MVRAILVGSLVSLCSALLGVSLVLKRYSMIGDGLSHVGFGALAIATAMNAAPLGVAIPIVILAAVLLLRISGNSKIKGDAAIALISTGALAIGVMVISMTTGMNTDVYNYMFGIALPESFTWPVKTCNLKRCMLETRIPLEGSDKELVMINFHLEDTLDSMSRQRFLTKQHTVLI